jgi:hypothetical protein
MERLDDTGWHELYRGALNRIDHFCVNDAMRENYIALRGGREAITRELREDEERQKRNEPPALRLVC